MKTQKKGIYENVMERDNKLAPSILSADFAHLGDDIGQIERAGVPIVHIDVMDGMFVPNISFGIPVIRSIRKQSKLFFDVHLMIEEPVRLVKAFAKAGADGISVHYEACEKLHDTLKAIHAEDVRACLVINPDTPVEKTFEYLDEVEMVLLMCVQPGQGGQAFREGSLERIQILRDEINRRGLAIDIEVDGGIRLSNLDTVLDAGANVIVAGTAVFEGNIADNVQKFNEHLVRKKRK